MLWMGRVWRKGERTKWLTIFAEKMKFAEFFSGKGKECKDLFSRQKPTASPTGKPGMRVGVKRLFDEKMPDCCSAAPHHLALQGASPQGEAYEID